MLLSAVALSASCDKYLDKGPEENLSVQQAFQERAYAERWLFNIYSGIPLMMNFHQGGFENPFVGGCDEMELTSGSADGQLFNQGAVNPAHNFGIWGQTAVFSRKCNLFLDNIELTPATPAEKSMWIGEVHFLRALYNFLSVRAYGPIPIYDKAMAIGSDFTKIERATLQECIDFIVSDCEEAAKRLPSKRASSLYGRATSVAALALKSRVLLYAASPLFNGNKDYSSMTNTDGEPLIPSEYDANKWKLAADAAKECIIAANEYALHISTTGDPVQSYSEIFTTNWNEEVLFAANVGINSLFEQCCDPVGLLGLSQYAPTQQIVDAFRMVNGVLPFKTDDNGEIIYSDSGMPTVIPESGYVESGFDENGISNMYVGREPRFYAQVNYSGANWKNHTCEFWNSGADGLKNAAANHSKTGYLLRKFADPLSSPTGVQAIVNIRSWAYFRLAEIYLNYAEALNESEGGDHVEALEYLNKVRQRGGIPALEGSYTKDELRLLIRQERRVELAFEDHRFFDVRRWKIAEDTDNTKIYGMNITAGTYLGDENFYKRTLVEERKFSSKHYLLPIQKTEIEKCPALVQNLGY